MNPTPFLINTLNNKYPCEGPRTVQNNCDFSTAAIITIDLKSLVMQGKISEVQALFVDNADNSAPVVITVSQSQQRVIVPAFSQAWLPILVNEPQLVVTTTTTVVVPVFACNFPVMPVVWTAPSSGGAPSSNVAITNYPTSQGINLTTSGISSAFNPQLPGYILTTGVTSSSVTIASIAGQNIRIVNTGTVIANVRWGTGAQTAVTTDLALAPNQSILVNSNGANTLAAISSAAGSLQISVGNGGFTA